MIHEPAKPPNILVVDDAPANLVAFRRTLSRSMPDARLHEATTVEEALRVTDHATMDVALLDLNLQESFDGLALLRKLKEGKRTSSIVVIMITGHSSESSIRAKALELGAEDFIIKPVEAVELVARIRVALRIRRAEEGLKAGRANLLNLVEHRDDGVVVVAADGRIRYANSATSKILDRESEKLFGAAFGIPLSGESCVEIAVPVTGGRVKLVEMRVAESSWDGDPASIVTLRDVTEKKLHDERLHQAQKMEAVGLLASSVVHDFKNLLQGIQGVTDLLKERLAEDDVALGLVEKIQVAATRSAEVSRQLLTFARAQPLEMENVNVNELAEASLQLLRTVVGQKIYVVFRGSEDVPPVRCASTQLELVLFNLCLNARDAMPLGGTLTVTIGTEEIDADDLRCRSWARPVEYLTMSVEDTGEGIFEEIRPRIFDPFFTTKNPGVGTGLGLASVYGIVTQHGGGIEVESSPGSGSVFTVYLPISKKQDS